MNKNSGQPQVKDMRTSNSLTGITLIEVMAALLIVGGAVIPLLYMRIESFASVRKAVLMQEAMHIAETAINKIYIQGYTFYEEQGYLPEDETRFDIQADFSAEEILLSSFTSREGEGEPDAASEEEKEKEEKIIFVHISVTVTSKEDKDISVSLKLDLPADTAEVEGIEAVLPDTTGK